MGELPSVSHGAEIGDDGFSNSGSSQGRSYNFLKWKAGAGWTDRDGSKAPSPLLAVRVDELLRRWQDERPTDITTKPLPDPTELNNAIPEVEWETGLDGSPRPPWQHHVAVFLVDPTTATKFEYVAATLGAHIAVGQLKENVVTMRMLRGANVLALVELTSRPMRLKYGMGERPDFQIVNWHVPGILTAPQLALSSVEPVTSDEAVKDEIPW